MLGKNLIKAAAAKAQPLYIEDVMSTWLYTGNNSTQTITNGIDLAGEGGLVWQKSRTQALPSYIIDTARGSNKILFSSLASSENTFSSVITSFNSTGFTLGPDNQLGYVNNNVGSPAVSWTFRKAPKFFDVVTWTGDGQSFSTVNHSLGTVPAVVIVKRTDTASDWGFNYLRGGAQNNTIIGLTLNSTAGQLDTGNKLSDYPYVTSTNFVPQILANSSSYGGLYNVTGATYVAYLFAHDAGGFGDSGNDSVVKCGSYTGNGSATGPTIDLGWEPQWLLIKQASGTAGEDWYIYDSMRGIATGGNDPFLRADLSASEVATSNHIDLLATGFQPTTTGTATNQSGTTYIYIAIRRGPMKTPTDATKVFDTRTLTQAYNTTTPAVASITTDLFITGIKNAPHDSWVSDRLRGASQLITNTTGQEAGSNYYKFDVQTGVAFGVGLMNTNSVFQYFFRRAPGFLDVVSFTSSGSGQLIPHNLGTIPELIILKLRTAIGDWSVIYADKTTSLTATLNTANPAANEGTYYIPTATTFRSRIGSANPQIAYLFASCPGVSKVGSYTGTGATLNIDCGFSNGARFVLIKRTDSTGDWFVWDAARGIVSGNDPYLLLNSAAVEVTSTDFIDPLSSGFQISSTAPAAINANGGTYIYLAIA